MKPQQTFTLTRTQGFESIVALDSLFTGDYWDDFCLPALLHPSTAQTIWMLGTGLGGGIRPLLATGKVKTIFGVDTDASALQESLRIHRSLATGGRYQPVISDATLFLTRNACRTKADVIFVDLFDEHGHVDVFSHPAFWKARRQILPETESSPSMRSACLATA